MTWYHHDAVRVVVRRKTDGCIVWVAKTGLTAQQRRMTVIANNLANVNTVAFKRDRAVFEDLLYQNIGSPALLMLRLSRRLD